MEENTITRWCNAIIRGCFGAMIIIVIGFTPGLIAEWYYLHQLDDVPSYVAFIERWYPSWSVLTEPLMQDWVEKQQKLK
ncbi:hypothetical protein [Arcobacter sp. FWKO B]|uniref:hypothetical protein n=1 Tax=Arcobacter sp. FWKO B TaxID=2593672 RepID=UPI0018A605F7|nr:hypothetical protein [Arcobacter sp. FWKO B]QOG13038.1 hypothetical protein FWKOB_10210 [Arcobacter sp. FWKO B]